MYAVIQAGGKQYKVAKGDSLKIEKIPSDIGANVDFNNVLLVGDKDTIEVGAPLVKGGKVTATVQSQGRDKKIKILKFKRRKHHMKRMGHRQSYTEVKITGIAADGFTIPQPTVAVASNVEETNVETASTETS